MKEEKIAVYPGTFDPITFGHLDIIKRASRLFDKIIVAVTTNPQKKSLFSLEERMQLIKACTKGMPFVEVDSFSDLLVEYVKKKNASIILRGLREVSDFEFEFQGAVTNRHLAPEIESVFIMTNEKFFYLSSSTVKEIASLGGKISDFVPKEVENALKEKLR